MKNYLFAFALVFAAADASAFGKYIGGSGGTSRASLHDDTDRYDMGKGGAWSMYAGIDLPIPVVPIRAELEYAQYNFDDRAQTWGIGVNALVGLPLLPILKPYIGMGIASYQVRGVSGSHENLSYMAGLDLNIPMFPIAGGVELRYIPLDLGDDTQYIKAALVKARVYF
ncbi:MAG: outer membrane beta-barrel protein [Alphaproteobacteria bacterium]|nr:outer membrane beta-barrel protein [Alphaproteobacteria bacterium]